jgi:hypothetical protein
MHGDLGLNWVDGLSDLPLTRPDVSPSRGSPCERLALSPVAGVSRWLLPLLSRLLSAAIGRHRLVWLSDPVYHGLTRCVETGRLADP